jgi:hypothetical protein
MRADNKLKKVVEKVLKAFLKARRITKWRIVTRATLAGRWEPWNNFFTVVTHLFLICYSMEQVGISFSTNQRICWQFRSKPIRMRINWLL